MEHQKYKIIYADPCWRYDREYKHKGSRDALMHYNTLSIEDLCKLKIKRICDKDCILFLWVTFPKLKESFRLIESWGFTYKTIAFNWVKKNKNGNNFLGMGRWTRANSEICLLATKGKPKRLSASVSQIIESRRESHSKKPDIVRSKIVELCGDVPRIELFAREKVDGWDCWGNEVESDVQLITKSKTQGVHK